jgi:hypothetical protein
MPEPVLATVVAVLFAAFGVQALRNAAADELQNLVESPGRGIFLTTFPGLWSAMCIELVVAVCVVNDWR